MEVCVCVKKVIRVGKPNKNAIRTLKNTLNSSIDAEEFKTSKKEALKGRGIYVDADLTPMQIENIKKLSQEENKEILMVRRCI